MQPDDQTRVAARSSEPREFTQVEIDPRFTPAPERMDSPLHRLRYLIVRANGHVRQPIDLNYVAIPKDDWEAIVAVIERG